MGFNVSGLIIKPTIDEKKLGYYLGEQLNFVGEVGIEEATSGFKDEGTIDIYYGDKATLLFTTVDTMYPLKDFCDHAELIQFIISETADTYYFEKFLVGELERKYIASEGMVEENIGDGIIDEEGDIMEQIWEMASEYLGFELFEQDIVFRRYE